jgi:hypothetical protein
MSTDWRVSDQRCLDGDVQRRDTRLRTRRAARRSLSVGWSPTRAVEGELPMSMTYADEWLMKVLAEVE